MPKAGFILPMAIILTSVCAISLAAVFSYVSFTTRMTQVHLGNTQCRLAAQSAIENAKEAVFKAFYSYTTSGNGTIKIGLINGMNGNLNPQGSATRAQVAAIMMRFCERKA